MRWRCWASALAIYALALQGLAAASIGAAQAAAPDDLPFLLCAHGGTAPGHPLDGGREADHCGLCCLAHAVALLPVEAKILTLKIDAARVERQETYRRFARLSDLPVYRSRAPPA